MRTARLLTVSQHALRKGVWCLPREWVSTQGVCLTGGGLCAHGQCVPGCSVCPGGVCSGEACLPGGCLPSGVCVADPPPPLTEWQIGVKTLPCRNFVAGGNYFFSKVGIIGISV